MNRIRETGMWLTLSLTLAWTLGASDLLVGEDGNRSPPNKVKQAAAEKIVRRRYRAEYASRSVKAMKDLARSLLRAGRETDDDPVLRFVLFREARDLSKQAGSAALALGAVEELVSHYELEELGEKTSAIEAVAEIARSPAQFNELAFSSLRLSREFVSSEHVRSREYLEAAERLSTIADVSAHNARNAALVLQARTLKKTVQAIKKEHTRYIKALRTLTRDRGNASAGFVAGRYLSLFVGDLEASMPHFELGGSPALGAVAKRERSRPRTALGRMQLGDVWWALETEARAFEKDRKKYPYQWYFLVRGFRLRAAYWYRKAAPDLDDLTRSQVQERIAVVNETRKTVLAGGKGGSPFEAQAARGGILVGLRYCQSPTSSRLRYVQPLFRHRQTIEAGAGFGSRNSEVHEVLARPGYAVGALIIRASPTRARGFRVVFMGVDGGRLDSGRHYESGWCGADSGPEELRYVGGVGKFSVGIAGRSGAHIDALGLVITR